jgi:ribosomal protein S18 acetylase RimI-like enzyme
MILKTFDGTKLYQYYENYVKRQTHYVLLDKDAFMSQIVHDKIVFVSYGQEINGFISACLDKDKAYISLLFGQKDVQEALYKTMEETLLSLDVKTVWIHFFNPVKLPWYPLKDVVHPAIQGVVYQSDLYKVYEKLGFKEHSIQETYYQDLSGFKFNYKDIKHSNQVEFYDPEKHHGLTEFAHQIGVDDWKNTILFNEKAIQPQPLLVALDDQKVVGFTGPIIKEPSQRGYFAGIGILDSYRNRGLGKALFYRLCHELKQVGAAYMTFFTGVNNSAKYIYLRAGFKVVERFATMKKNLREDV